MCAKKKCNVMISFPKRPSDSYSDVPMFAHQLIHMLGIVLEDLEALVLMA